MPGRSLERKVAEDGPYDEGGLIRLAIATAAALNAIHSAGVVHRDFKPANVLLGPDGPRVIDFGIAKALDTAHLTIGGIKGTPAYMSPEQARAEPVGPPSDIFSWASTMYYAATGTLAFTDVLHHQPHLDRVPAPLRPLMAACFNKDPSRRPTAEQLMTAIAR
ncbi:serine/threonine-protein kinase [Nonomuraea sp. NPDC049649]|uniref:serine/threonine-protein kinase n=1 Tax=Nonomuraea sp. NPDC049649 TaxID=3155776 RepID=UPI00343A1CC9